MSSLRSLFACVGLFADKEVKASSPESKTSPSKFSHLVVNTDVGNQPVIQGPVPSGLSMTPAVACATVTQESILALPEANKISPQSALDSERLAQRRAWHANIRRIKQSPYYNAAGDILDLMMLIDKSEDPNARLTPAEKNKLRSMDFSTVGAGCISPRFLGKPFEFTQMGTPSKSASKSPLSSRSVVQREKLSDHFTVIFNDPEHRGGSVSAKFVVTNHDNVVVVNSKADFDAAKLFQAAYPDAAKSFGFLRILWIDPVERSELDRSDHPDWVAPAPEPAPRLTM